MTRLRLTRLSQDGPYEPICVELAVTDGESMIPGEGDDTESDADTLPAARPDPLETSEDDAAVASDEDATEASDEDAAEASEDETTDGSEDEVTPVPGEARFDDPELDEIPTSPGRDRGTE
jgi:hypothetical protein